jgi:hypothetical protein
MLELLISKINVKSGALGIGALTLIFGAGLSVFCLPDSGLIDLHSAFVSGRFKGVSVGLFFALLGTAIVLSVLLRRPQTQGFKVGVDGVEWHGNIGNLGIILQTLVESTRRVSDLPTFSGVETRPESLSPASKSGTDSRPVESASPSAISAQTMPV